MLMEYLSDDFSQGLINKQKKIDYVLKKFAEKEIKDEKKRQLQKKKHSQKYDLILKILTLRGLLG